MDLSFNKFLTTTLVKIIWNTGLPVNILFAIGSFIGGLMQLSDGSSGAWAILVGPILAAFSLLILRVWLELIIVLFKIADNTSKLVELSGPAVTMLPDFDRPAPFQQ